MGEDELSPQAIVRVHCGARPTQGQAGFVRFSVQRSDNWDKIKRAHHQQNVAVWLRSVSLGHGQKKGARRAPGRRLSGFETIAQKRTARTLCFGCDAAQASSRCGCGAAAALSTDSGFHHDPAAHGPSRHRQACCERRAETD